MSYVAYSTLLLIYFVPETMACFLFLKWIKPVPILGLLHLLLPLCRVPAWLSALLALSHHPTVSLNGTSSERTSPLSLTTLSQPPCHSTVLDFLQSWDSTSSLSDSLLSLNCKLMESSNLGSVFSAVPPMLGAKLTHTWGRKKRRGVREERKDKNAWRGGSNANK